MMPEPPLTIRDSINKAIAKLQGLRESDAAVWI
jgi:hypothetical protein